jgi:RNA polymerase sigma-70 factor (ECF subfamily)
MTGPGHDELVDDFRSRRAKGLEVAYALWKCELFTVAFRTLGERNRAEDCVHDALMRVWGSRNTFLGERRLLRAYLLMSVRNEALSSLRSESRRARRELRAARMTPDDLHASDPGAELLDPVEAQRVRAALRHLPAEQRAAIESVYFDNKTHGEIAAETGTPLGTVKSRIALGMRKLQSELAGSRVART